MLYKWFSRVYHTIVFIIFLGIFIHIFAPILVEASPISNVFINEIHYDNTGADKDEFIELAAAAGINLAGWSLHLYNGSSGEDYNIYTFSDWLINDTDDGFGFAGVQISSIQNGSPDGVVLADAEGSIIQFLSYEGSFTASAGIALGLESIDIGVFEPSNTPIDFSLQLTGLGSEYKDFTWSSPQVSSFSIVNLNQSFKQSTNNAIPVSEPSSILLFLFAALLLIKSSPFILNSSKNLKLPSTSFLRQAQD